MTPAGASRHCAACQKVVVDFSQKTDAEILAVLARASGETCGRFRADQLGRPLVPPIMPSPWRNWLASLLALGGVLSSSRAAGQTRNNYIGPLPAAVSTAPLGNARPSPMDSAAASAAIKPASTIIKDPLVIQGVVRDKDIGLPGATVLVKGTVQGVSTNADGEFSLTLVDKAEAVLLVSSIGYVTIEVPVCGTAGETVLVQPQLAEDVKGLMTVGVVPPAPWHPQALVGWARYWISRPFRRY